MTVHPVLTVTARLFRWLVWGVLSIWLVAGNGARSGHGALWAAEQQPRPVVWRLSIARAPLAEALQQLARQADIQFARFSDAAASDVRVGPLKGAFTREQALDRLLREAGLTYRFVNERTVAILPIPAATVAAESGAPAGADNRPGAPAGSAAVIDGELKGSVEMRSEVEVSRRPGFWSRFVNLLLNGPADRPTAMAGSSPVGSHVSVAAMAACGVLAMSATCRASAAEDGSAGAGILELEEITVSARKREESLQDVPISISVMSSEELEKKGITGTKELFNSTPGLALNDFTGMRKDSRLGIRGVESADSTVTRQKVSSFIDGVPISGQAGNLSMAGLRRVEVLRGPQSSSFGRATFAGALNYVTEDASPEFTARVNAGWSEHAGRDLAATVSGPINDSLGYRVMALKSQWDGPSEWRTRGGQQLGSQQTEQLVAKLNYKFGDRISGAVLYNRRATADTDYPNPIGDPAVCNGNSTITRTRQNASVRLYNNGYVDCEVDLSRLQLNPDLLGQFKAQYNPALYGNVPLATYLARTLSPTNPTTYEQAILRATINDPRDRQFSDRVQGETNIAFGNNTLKLVAMTSHEHGGFWTDRDTTDSVAVMRVTAQGANLDSNVTTRGFRSRLDEKYYEVRWLSDDARKVRYVLSASKLSYNYLETVHTGFGAIAYDLRLPNGAPVDPLLQNYIQESANNVGLGGGVQWDVIPRLTLSLEGRAQSDDVCGSDPTANNNAGAKVCQKTRSFQPRLSANFKLTEDLSLYAQVSRGNNPASVNIQLANDTYRNAMLIAAGKIVNPADGFIYNGTDPKRSPKISYSPETYLTYEEESLDNYELGIKGNYPNRRGIFSVSGYYMDWKNIQNRAVLDWSAIDVCVNGAAPSATTGCGSAANTLSYGWNNNLLNVFSTAPVVVNAGGARLYGVELETQYSLLPSLAVGGNLVVSRAVHDSQYCSIEALQFGNLPASVQFITHPVLGRCALTPGKDITGVTNNGFPRYSVNANIDYLVPFKPFGSNWKVSLDAHKEGPRYIDELNLTKQRGVTTANLSTEWRTDRITVRAYVNNLTDEDMYQYMNNIRRNYVTNPANPAASIAAAPGAYTFVPRRPREFGLKVVYDFR